MSRGGAGKVCYFAATSAEAQRGQADILKVTEPSRDRISTGSQGTAGGTGRCWKEGRAGCQPGPWLTSLAPDRSSSPRRCCRARPPWARWGSCPAPRSGSCSSTCEWPPGTRSSTPGCTSCFAGQWSSASTLAWAPGPGHCPCSPSSPAGQRYTRS